VQAQQIGGEVAQLGDGLWRARRGHQADPAAHRRGGEADGESVAILADVEHCGGVWHRRDQPLHVVQECACIDGHAITPGDHS
jgi:hypothetical protein